LTFIREDVRVANLVSAALFGDGGAGAILGTDEGPCRISSSKSVFFYDSMEQMGFDLDEQGFRIILDKGVPELIAREFPPALNKFLREQSLDFTQLSTFVFHPGGRTILDTMEQLGVSAGDLAVSRAVLREVGNLSSASILYVLAETLRLGRGVGLGLLGAFGPGFNAELLLSDFGKAGASAWTSRFGGPTVAIS
jgi:predicted naringenin-chalcone synthase